MAHSDIGAVIIAADSFLTSQNRRIAELALRHHLPSATQALDYSMVGGLMSYGQDLNKNYVRAATYVDKILRGAKPADLPIEQPTVYEMIVNLKTARALGLKVPDTILLQATKVIE